MRDFYGPAWAMAVAISPPVLLKLMYWAGMTELNGLFALLYLACFVVFLPGVPLAFIWFVVVLVRKLNKAGGALPKESGHPE